MNDLNTINRLNAEAFAASIGNYQRQGRFVVAEYAGLSLVAIETFTNETEALAKFESLQGRKDSTRGKLFFPVGNVSALYPPIPDGACVSASARPAPLAQPGLALDSGEFVTATSLNATPVALGDDNFTA